MDYEDLLKSANEKSKLTQALKEEPFYKKTVAWLGYLGLLRHSTIVPSRHRVHLRDALKAGELEPRIFEVLPALIVLLPEALEHTKRDLPKDLAAVIHGIKNRQDNEYFRGISPQKYQHWLNSSVIDTARRRLDFRKTPRKRLHKNNFIGDIIREGRMKLALTQIAFAEKYGLPLRIIRDLEQGKMNTSLKSASKILKILGRTLRA